ncbi:MAG: FAD-dependent monooxygenase [Methylophilales bacterium]|nr:FAD-dependent monooxygenase [Methylophilales bacterium]
MKDIVIVGGGPVGATLALALVGSGFDVTVLEAQTTQKSDPRAIALAEGSKLILQRLGVWESLQTTPIKTIHVSEKGRLGRTVLKAEQMKQEALGYVVDYVQLSASLSDALAKSEVNYQRGAAVSQLLPAVASCNVNFEQDQQAQTLETKLAVLADGGRSLNDVHKLPRKVREYEQSALVARIEAEAPHDNIAYERFTKKGPVALLPWGERGFTLVWTALPENAQALRDLEEAQFLNQLHEHFGDRVGRFTKVTARMVFPLKMAWVRPSAAEHLAVIGNAAQTLHPVAGQGFNLGLRDAWELAHIIRETDAQDLGSARMLAEYRASRRTDTGASMLFTDLLIRAFDARLPASGILRGAGLVALDLFPPARNFLLRKMSFGAKG